MYRPARENPSFSSSLLDEIYRSIDERDDHESVTYRETTREKLKQSSFSIDTYFQKEVRSVVDFRTSSNRSVNSNSSSSDSSSGGGFSSSEAESMYGVVSSRPKPIRTSMNRHYDYDHGDHGSRANQVSINTNTCDQRYQFEDVKSKPKHEGKFVKTKSRAMKIYGDLKKVKQQPISPGGRLATFLNSVFTTNNAKNVKNEKNAKLSSCGGSYDDDDGRTKSVGGSTTCSSASSFSRSCLSKAPSSRGKLSNKKNRSVRFYPVSVIVGDDLQPCGHKSLFGEEPNLHALKFVKNVKNVRNPNDDEIRARANEKTRRIEEAARSLLRNYQKKVECEYDLIADNVKAHREIGLNYEDDDDDDDDAASSTSSDLFELENFSAIGMEDELPVYETTYLDANLAFGNVLRV